MSNEDTIRTLLKEFNKEEVFEVAEDLEMSISANTSSKAAIQAILLDLEDNGVPEEDDCSDITYEFMLTAGIFDDDALDDIEPAEETKGVKDYEQPPCFSWADARAPECNRCVLYASCTDARNEIRETLPCFGLMFDVNAEECQGCLESGPCRTQLETI